MSDLSIMYFPRAIDVRLCLKNASCVLTWHVYRIADVPAYILTENTIRDLPSVLTSILNQCCYIKVDYATNASQKGIWLTQQVCHITIFCRCCSMIKDKVLVNNPTFLLCSELYGLSYEGKSTAGCPRQVLRSAHQHLHTAWGAISHPPPPTRVIEPSHMTGTASGCQKCYPPIRLEGNKKQLHSSVWRGGFGRASKEWLQ